MSEVVLFDELTAIHGKKIGVATLNSPKSLNALSHDMVHALLPKLRQWQDNPDIAMVLVQGSGEKAFCAGGDIVHLYKGMQNDTQGAQSASQYFCDEYKLDYLIHAYNKPLLVWGSGIVMGGGLGLMAGASHRIVTETSRIAMPEITIGLFPDVGGSYFLNRMPKGCGLFLGLTGASVNAADALHVNLADHFLTNERKQVLLDQLIEVHWGDTISLNHEKLTKVLSSLGAEVKSSLPKSNLVKHQQLIESLTSGSSLSEIVDAITTIDSDDKWLQRAQKTLQHGSPLSAHIIYRQLQTSKPLSLSDCFRFELSLASKCAEYGEFQEGVRALLIEKDNQPKWKFATIDEVDPQVLDWFFECKWQASNHPLAELGLRPIAVGQ
ncbi:enoyl-CoA hydratase/isomerase family protein [Thalassotalea mangrovi]|uniref:3-hydroxyisobutyryl-CoA hydrolase n=1 Tax=Thalassotalea mangrovi TaxID=2572245 RepID=A0A4U1B219_9GAMM|nr:enoyl-CoA hydratase/isomerase family protein [Thalassotalea mangrovi]TKB43086.1 enoyl-CoA hydratase/isomerase family protein [Thalassotalea mangrovi]